MRRMYLLKEVSGKVFMDSANKGIRDADSKVLMNVRVNLLRADDYTPDENRQDKLVGVYSYKTVASTMTDSKGEYRFLIVPDGKYMVEIDTSGLPEGTGAVRKSVELEGLPALDVDFAVRNAESIELAGMPQQIYFGQTMVLKPIVKDAAGNALWARTSYSCDKDELDVRNDRVIPKYRRLEYGRMAVNVSCGPITRSFAFDIKVPECSSLDRVRLAYDQRLIKRRDRVMSSLYSLFDRDKLNEEFRSGAPVKSGTTAIEDIYRYIQNSRADKKVVKAAREYIRSAVPELDKSYVSPGGFFRIHYTLEGEHAVPAEDKAGSGIPDYVKLVAESFDHVRAVTCLRRGFNQPLLQKGEREYHVYLYNLKGVYGITFPADVRRSKRGPRVAESYIALDNNYSRDKGFKTGRDDCVRVTAAHEFFHAVQNSYNLDADAWWKEATATWNEDEIYDNINDYINYLPSLFSDPLKPLEKCSYGGVVFAKFITENYGGYRMMLKIWEAQGKMYRNSLNSIEQAVRAVYRKENIESIFKKYSAFNYHPSQYYREGKLWNQSAAATNEIGKYPAGQQLEKLDHLAAGYEVLRPQGNEGSKVLKISIDELSEHRMGLQLQMKKAADGLCLTSEIKASRGAEHTVIECRGFGSTYSEVCLIPANLEREKDGARLKYTAVVE